MSHNSKVSWMKPMLYQVWIILLSSIEGKRERPREQWAEREEEERQMRQGQ